MDFLLEARKKQAKTIIANLEKRNINGYYFDTAKECTAFILSLLKDNQSVTWGGSMSIKQSGLIDAVKESGKFTVYDRAAFSPENMDEYNKLAFSSDCYLMSSNAITIGGELVNIDGNGNRVASLIFGPKKVFLIIGMNKVANNTEDALMRVRNIASPPNTIRLSKNTPCAATGKCGDCYCDDCICNQIVITRRSREKERIHVFLVGENLGF